MYNKTKIKMLVAFGILALIGFIGMIGYTLGNQVTLNKTTKEVEKNTTAILERKTKEESEKNLTDDKVKSFLLQYFTKAKLGDNNGRIKQFMTESAYNEELEKQKLAVNQVNKEFVVDYTYEEANIFINSETKEAIADISYSVTYLSEISDGKQHKNRKNETITVKLAYTAVSGTLLVNQIVPWQISLSDMSDGGANLINQTNSGDSSSSIKPSIKIETKTSETE